MTINYRWCAHSNCLIIPCPLFLKLMTLLFSPPRQLRSRVKRRIARTSADNTFAMFKCYLLACRLQSTFLVLRNLHNISLRCLNFCVIPSNLLFINKSLSVISKNTHHLDRNKQLPKPVFRPTLVAFIRLATTTIIFDFPSISNFPRLFLRTRPDLV